MTLFLQPDPFGEAAEVVTEMQPAGGSSPVTMRDMDGSVVVRGHHVGREASEPHGTSTRGRPGRGSAGSGSFVHLGRTPRQSGRMDHAAMVRAARRVRAVICGPHGRLTVTLPYVESS